MRRTDPSCPRVKRGSRAAVAAREGLGAPPDCQKKLAQSADSQRTVGRRLLGGYCSCGLSARARSSGVCNYGAMSRAHVARGDLLGVGICGSIGCNTCFRLERLELWAVIRRSHGPAARTAPKAVCGPSALNEVSWPSAANAWGWHRASAALARVASVACGLKGESGERGMRLKIGLTLRVFPKKETGDSE